MNIPRMYAHTAMSALIEETMMTHLLASDPPEDDSNPDEESTPDVEGPSKLQSPAGPVVNVPDTMPPAGPLPNRKALDNLADALVEDILSLSDEEILAEFREDGIDLEQNAAEMRALFERVVRENPPTPPTPAGYCPFCGEVAHARARTPLHALLFAPTYCSSCGDPCPYRICAACLESNLALQNARDALERGMVTEGWHVELIIARLRAHARQSWAV